MVIHTVRCRVCPVLAPSKLVAVFLCVLSVASACASDGGDVGTVVEPEPTLTVEATAPQPTALQAPPAPTEAPATPAATPSVEPEPTATAAVPEPTAQPTEPAFPDPTPTEAAPEPGSPEPSPTPELSVAEEVYEVCTAPDLGGDDEIETELEAELDELLAAEGIYLPEEPAPMSGSECQRLAECVADSGMSLDELEQISEQAESFSEVFDLSAHCYPPRWFAFFNDLGVYLDAMIEFLLTSEQDTE